MGYARVSSSDQNLDRQITALKDAGIENRAIHQVLERMWFLALIQKKQPYINLI